jgi:hypothetical protein
VQLSTNIVRGASEGRQCDCAVWRSEPPVQGRAAVTNPLGHLHPCDVAFKHSLFDLPCNQFLDRDNAVPISVDSINEAGWAKGA